MKTLPRCYHGWHWREIIDGIGVKLARLRLDLDLLGVKLARLRLDLDLLGEHRDVLAERRAPMKEQAYSHLAVVDIEATCDDRRGGAACCMSA